MTAEQKQRAADLLAAWRATAYALHADRMADLLQELVDAPTADTLLTWTPNDDTGDITDTDGTEYYFARENAIAMCRVVMAAHAPEAEPFAVIHLDGSFVHVEFKQSIAGTGKFEVYAAPPAPSVPDGWIRAIDEAMVVHHIGIADRADGYEEAKKKLNELLAINSDIARYCSEPPADVARDAERWQMLPAFLAEFQVPYLRLVDKIDAAIEREILGGAQA